MRCALVSSRLDLKFYLGPEISRIADRIEVVDHATSDAANDVRLAVAWHPPDDAFARYPNLQAVCSIGAGVDNIVACPSLKPHIDVIRVVDPGQAQMMSGFVAWHVIGHQRGFAGYRTQQREHVWQRRPQRGADSVPVGILGNGEIGRKVERRDRPAALAHEIAADRFAHDAQSDESDRIRHAKLLLDAACARGRRASSEIEAMVRTGAQDQSCRLLPRLTPARCR